MTRAAPHSSVTLPARASAAPLRVLMVTPRFHPEVGGVEVHVREVARRLPRHGVQVTVLTTTLDHALPRREFIDGVSVVRVPAVQRTGDARLAPGLAAAIAAEPCDLIHIQSYHTLVAPMAMRAARAARIPYVATFHGGGHSGRIRSALRPTQMRALGPLLRSAQRLVAVASFEVDLYSDLLGVGTERFAVVPNGSELPPPSPTSHAIRRTRIASIGRLERYKGHHRVVAAMAKVVAARPDARLWIAGTGPEEGSLRRQIAQLDLHGYVEIRSIPSDDRAQMAERLAEVSVAVMMSDWETHPIAAVEALSAGARLVVADSSGLAELAARGFARAVSPDADADELAAAIVAEMDATAPVARPVLPTWDQCAAGLAAVYLHAVVQ